MGLLTSIPPTDHQHRKLYLWLGHLVSFIMMALAVHLYQERLNLDAGHYIAKVINAGWFHIENSRLIIAFSQVLPVVAIKLDMNLKTVLLAYSLNPPVYFYGFFLLFAYGYKHTGSAWTIILTQVVGLTHGYFAPMYELYYLIPLIILCYHLLRHSRSIAGMMVAFLSVVIIVNGHLNGAILLVFVLGYDYMQHKQMRTRMWVSMVVALVTALVLRKLFPSPYDAERLDYLLDLSRNKSYQNLMNPGYLIGLIKYLLRHYWEALLLLIPPTLHYILNGKWAELYWGILLFLGNILLIQLMYYGLDEGRYAQQVYFPLVVIASFMFGACMHRYANWSRLPIALLLLVVIVSRLNALVVTSERYTGEVQEIQAVTKHARHQLGGSKFKSQYRNLVHNDMVAGHWSYPIQTLLISAIDGPDSAVTIQFDYHADSVSLRAHEHLFRFREVIPDTSINQRYFQLQPGPYLPLQHNLEDSTLEVQSWDNLIWQVLTTDSVICLSKDRFTSVPLALRVAPGKRVYVDADNQIFFSYHWYRGDKEIEWNGLRTAVEVDITDTHQQRLMLKTPAKRGLYTLEVGLVHEHVQWYKATKKYTVQID